MGLKLRPYQQQASDAWERHYSVGCKNSIIQLATGLGKTLVGWSLIHEHFDLHKHRIMWMAHVGELITQPKHEALSQFPEWGKETYTAIGRPGIGIVMNTYDETHARIIIGTVQTLSNQKRLDEILRHGVIDLLVIDECHHAVADTYLYVIDRLREANPALSVLGLTATPQRTDGIGLVNAFKDGKIIYSMDIMRGIGEGWLKPLQGITVHTPIHLAKAALRSDGTDFNHEELARVLDAQNWKRIIADAYREKAGGRRAIAFMPSVEMSIEFASIMRSRGVRAAHIDGATIIDEHGDDPVALGLTYSRMRREVIQRFNQGKIDLLTNFNVLMEGFNGTNVGCIIWARPTLSNTLFTQGVGRGTRLPAGLARMTFDHDNNEYVCVHNNGSVERIVPEEMPGPPDCIVLDFAAEDVKIVQFADIFGKGLPAAKPDVLNDMLADSTILVDIMAGQSLKALLTNSSKFLYDGQGQRYSRRSLFGGRDEAWFVSEFGEQVVGVGQNHILYIKPPDYGLVDQIEARTMRLMRWLDANPNADSSLVRRYTAKLYKYQEMLILVDNFTLWHVEGKRVEKGDRGMTLWGNKVSKTYLIGAYDNPQDCVTAAFPLAAQYGEGYEAITNKGKAWRNRPATAKQLDILCNPQKHIQQLAREAGLNIPKSYDGISAGEAAQLISYRVAQALVVIALHKLLNHTISDRAAV